MFFLPRVACATILNARDDKLLCVGEIALYLEAKALLGSETLLPVAILERKGAE